MNKTGISHDGYMTTNKGITYEVPNGLDESKYHDLIYEFTDLIKEKGLTIRQALYLLDACKDYILEFKPESDAIKNIYEALSKIST